jgi:hypothetical protein
MRSTKNITEGTWKIFHSTTSSIEVLEIDAGYFSTVLFLQIKNRIKTER